MQRSLMSDRLAERLGNYQNYEFVSSEAREQFEQLLQELQEDVLNTYFQKSKEFLNDPDSEELARTRESLDDVVRAMAERAAAAEAMFNSLSGEQQGELRALFDRMMQNMELDFALNRLVSNLRQATPDIDWNRAHRMRGNDPSSFAQTASVAEQLGELRGLEQFLGQGNAAQGLPEVDVDAVRRNLGADAAQHVVRLQRALKALKDQGFIDHRGGHLTLSAKGVRQIGQQVDEGGPPRRVQAEAASSQKCREAPDVEL